MNEKKRFQPGLFRAMVGICLFSLVLALPVQAQQASETLQQKVERLTRELDEAKRQLAENELEELVAEPTANTLAESKAEPAETEPPVADPGPGKITPGDLIPALEGLTIGGAVRVNYFFGDYNDNSPETGADAAGYGTIALDTFRINMDYERGPWIGKFEYGWATILRVAASCKSVSIACPSGRGHTAFRKVGFLISTITWVLPMTWTLV